MPVSPPNEKRVPTRSKDALIRSPNEPPSPKKRLGSVELSNTNSPGSPHASTTAPCSTMIMYWPSFTAMTDPSEMMLSSPSVLDERPCADVRLCPFATSVFASSELQ